MPDNTKQSNSAQPQTGSKQFLDFDLNMSTDKAEDICSLVGTTASAVWLAGGGLVLAGAPLLGFGVFGGVSAVIGLSTILPPVITASYGTASVLQHLNNDEQLNKQHDKTKDYGVWDAALDTVGAVSCVANTVYGGENIKPSYRKGFRAAFTAAALGATAIVGIPLLSTAASWAAVPAFMYAAYHIGPQYMCDRHNITLVKKPSDSKAAKNPAAGNENDRNDDQDQGQPNLPAPA